QDNGGDSFTQELLAGSLAIDAGNNANVPPGVTTDQRGDGFDRIVNGTVDIGAFEVQLTPTPLTFLSTNAIAASNLIPDPIINTNLSSI
ncbi:MAG: choice-of-anchor Q domain-containing protein, partial [Prochloraceae cyanobacterium]|nr:choice-of-anchor Q domain-containing protein [Prochloraceae cyanobacterium]